MLKEFKTFIMRGNVLDMAVGIIIGAAFTKIVNSFVSDVLTPPLGKALGRVDMSALFLNLSDRPVATLEEAKTLGLPVIKYGLFLNNVLDFILVGFAVFCLIKFINSLKAKPVQTVEPVTKDCPYCISTVPIKATRCGHCTSALT